MTAVTERRTTISPDSIDTLRARLTGQSFLGFQPLRMQASLARAGTSCRSIMAAIKVVKDRNASVPDSSLRDWVSLVTFDTVAGSDSARWLACSPASE